MEEGWGLLWYAPWRAALYPKNKEVVYGPNISCPATIFFNVVRTSRLGNTRPMKLYHICCDTPNIKSPYPAILNVLKKSTLPEGGIVIFWHRDKNHQHMKYIKLQIFLILSQVDARNDPNSHILCVQYIFYSFFILFYFNSRNSIEFLFFLFFSVYEHGGFSLLRKTEFVFLVISKLGFYLLIGIKYNSFE